MAPPPRTDLESGVTEPALTDASEITVELDKVDSLVLAAQRLVKDGR